jgi:hypothetical protein
MKNVQNLKTGDVVTTWNEVVRCDVKGLVVDCSSDKLFIQWGDRFVPSEHDRADFRGNSELPWYCER